MKCYTDINKMLNSEGNKVGSMQSQSGLQQKRYLETITRRKWLILGCLLLGITCGLIFYLKHDNVYRCETLLSYQQPKISTSQMSSDEQATTRDIISTLTQIVVSRSSLEKMINEENLYADLRAELPMEDVVEVMRDRIKIVRSRSGDTLALEYEGSDPAEVVRVTNELAERFIDEDLKYQKQRASETYAYTQNELEVAKAMLERKEVMMSDYKLKYYNEMPAQLAKNMSRLAASEDKYQAIQKSIQDLERTRILVNDQINEIGKNVEENLRQADVRQAGERQQGTSINIDQRTTLVMLKSSLSELQVRHTDQHPTVKRLKKQIASVERIIEEEEQQRLQSATQAETQKSLNEELFSLETQLKDISFSIDKLEQEKEEFRVLIKKYKEWVASSPVREEEWSSLQREYGELKRRYDSLITQNLRASSALNLEGDLKGSRVRVETAARLPETPVKPDFIKILFVSVMAGLSIGGLLALVLDMLDTSFKSKVELENTLDLPVICSVPSLPLAGETIKKQFWSFVRISVFLIWFSALCVALVFLGKEGKIVTPYIQFLK